MLEDPYVQAVMTAFRSVAGDGPGAPASLLPEQPDAAVYEGLVLFTALVRAIRAEDSETERLKREAVARGRRG